MRETARVALRSRQKLTTPPDPLTHDVDVPWRWTRIGMLGAAARLKGHALGGRVGPALHEARGLARVPLHKLRRSDPNWRFDEASYERTAASFDNPDFVDVVIQSYRHRYGAVAGDPEVEAIEGLLAAQPRIAVPTIVLHGAADGVSPPEDSEPHRRHFSGPYARRVIPLAGHFLPREAPAEVVRAVRELSP